MLSSEAGNMIFHVSEPLRIYCFAVPKTNKRNLFERRRLFKDDNVNNNNKIFFHHDLQLPFEIEKTTKLFLYFFDQLMENL